MNETSHVLIGCTAILAGFMLFCTDMLAWSSGRAEMGHIWWTLISIIIVLVGVYILYREYKHGSGE